MDSAACLTRQWNYQQLPVFNGFSGWRPLCESRNYLEVIGFTIKWLKPRLINLANAIHGLVVSSWQIKPELAAVKFNLFLITKELTLTAPQVLTPFQDEYLNDRGGLSASGETPLPVPAETRI